ncbi:MAG TPA: 2-thiouracil desulfurase family protein [Polyangiaceae bacterium]|nr:2-thiouracil desulfurase family protein [Polyangiaceae bacterium]
MRLPHHPELIDALRRPSAADPWRVLLSGCLSGAACGVDGTDYGLGAKLPQWLRGPAVRTFPFCPEDYRLGTPRSMPDLHDGDGFAVLDGKARVLDEKRRDLTAAMLEGARAMLALARAERVDFALLTDRSGACGSQVISIGCRFEEPVQHRRGVGVAAAMLLREGFHVVSQRDFASLERLRAIVEPGHVPDPEARDHHEHPWVLENLPLPD